MSKHTPGKWMQQGRYIVADNGFTVADLQPMGGHNACLIAAAPELLEALLALLNVSEELCGLELKEMKKAHAAIAKAIGNKE